MMFVYIIILRKVIVDRNISFFERDVVFILCVFVFNSDRKGKRVKLVYYFGWLVL